LNVAHHHFWFSILALSILLLRAQAQLVAHYNARGCGNYNWTFRSHLSARDALFDGSIDSAGLLTVLGSKRYDGSVGNRVSRAIANRFCLNHQTFSGALTLDA
jgi:hypothetical protein